MNTPLYQTKEFNAYLKESVKQFFELCEGELFTETIPDNAPLNELMQNIKLDAMVKLLDSDALRSAYMFYVSQIAPADFARFMLTVASVTEEEK